MFIFKVSPDESHGIKPQLFHSGESGSYQSGNTVKSIRDTTFGSGPYFSSTPDYSNVDFGNEYRFGSTFRGPDYLPPLGNKVPFVTMNTSIEHLFQNHRHQRL